MTQLLNEIKVLAGILLFYWIVGKIFHIGCPILWMTGISCAGCGMTRAWISLCRLDFVMAFYYHPLFWLPPVLGIGYLIQEKLPKRLSKVLGAIVIVLFLMVYILRLLNANDTIVIFQPEDGFIGKLILNVIKNRLQMR
ncbi:MAG: DUF2752 domain-containing protein [Lachnospiraceae bacterium]|nr:DUF2752 domain-containing protein [Lachnospiraceae bacterium]